MIPPPGHPRDDRPPPLAYARVAINRPLAQPYTYFVPESMSERIRVGSLVEVPLRNEAVAGVVVDLVDAPDTKAKIKPIARHLSPEFALDPPLVDLAAWIADYYFCAPGEALACVSMIGLNDLSARTRTVFALADPRIWLATDMAEVEGRRPTPTQLRVIQALLAEGNRPQTISELTELAEVSDSVPRGMLARGWLVQREQEQEVESPMPPLDPDQRPAPPLELTPAQQIALAPMLDALHSGAYKTLLLHGVTGSGKTELYLRTIEESLRIGRGAIVLVPEIALTPQTVQTFRRRLGLRVGVYHSRLSLGQKFDLWRQIRAGEVRVVIGARSALFSPIHPLGVIIVDEEHESTYKQGEVPRYQARDMAVLRGTRENALVVLGSATPSVESLHNAREGKYGLLELPERVGPHASPRMVVIDMKRHWREGKIGSTGESMLSPPLRDALARRLELGEQSLLLLNRRGFANQVVCMACGAIRMCDNCAVPMTWHKQAGTMLCHWCGFKAPLPKTCAECGADEIQGLGLGTQRIEEVLAELFPTARVLRVDTDSMRRRGALETAWRKIQGGEVDFILGTQMIAKGLHLEQITLVGVILADFALFMPDFRSSERTYSLLTQVAGRAGRGALAGEVIVQSFMPQHFAIDCAARLNGDQFYERELRNRRMLRFPPFGRLISIIVAGENEEAVREQAQQLGGMLKPLVYRTEYYGVRVLGPTPAPLGRLEGEYRWRLLARGERSAPLRALVREGLTKFADVHRRAAVSVTVDVDPFDMM